MDILDLLVRSETANAHDLHEGSPQRVSVMCIGMYNVYGVSLYTVYRMYRSYVYGVSRYKCCGTVRLRCIGVYSSSAHPQ